MRHTSGCDKRRRRMIRFGELFQAPDWKTENHVPVIECPDCVQKDGTFEIRVSIGKEIPHPNTTEHHIRWIKVFYLPDGDRFTYQLAHVQFSAHGESAAGPDQGPAHTDHSAVVTARLKKSGRIYATSYCNIHGLWENTRSIQVH
jgi:superoxide reductase